MIFSLKPYSPISIIFFSSFSSPNYWKVLFSRFLVMRTCSFLWLHWKHFSFQFSKKIKHLFAFLSLCSRKRYSLSRVFFHKLQNVTVFFLNIIFNSCQFLNQPNVDFFSFQLKMCALNLILEYQGLDQQKWNHPNNQNKVDNFCWFIHHMIIGLWLYSVCTRGKLCWKLS